MTDVVDHVQKCVERFRADEVEIFDARGLTDAFPKELDGYSIADIEVALRDISKRVGGITPETAGDGKNLWRFGRTAHIRGRYTYCT